MQILKLNSTKCTGSKKTGPITERVKTFEDACYQLGIDPDNILTGEIDGIFGSDVKSINAYCRLIIIIRALNEGWKPDWNNENQRKWYPWFKMSPGFAFSNANYANWFAFTFVGSRLCLYSEALAKYAGEQFAEEYNQFLSL